MSERAAFTMMAFRITSIALETARPISESDTFSMKVDSSPEILPVEDDEDLWTCTVDCRAEFEDETDVPFLFAVSAVGVFRTLDEQAMKKELWDRVMRTQAPALVYSQLRPTIRVLMADAGYEHFILPMINFYAKADEDDSQSSLDFERNSESPQ